MRHTHRHEPGHFAPKAHTKYLPFLAQEEMGLLDFLMRKFDGISRNKAKSLLSHGAVKVDGAVQSRHDFEVKKGMVVEVSRHAGDGVEEDFNQYFGIVYEDDDIIVVDKADGVLSMGVGVDSLNMKTLLDNYFTRTRQRCRAHVVHRLDTRTSGIMLYAKSIEVQQIFISDWHGWVKDRRYIAVLEGVMEQPEGTIESWLRDTDWLKVLSSDTDNGGKWSSTSWRTRSNNGRYSLVEFKLQTGRKNQIRVHAESLGHPVVGDRKYGAATDPVGRMCLHAYCLEFIHPITHELLHFETPIPVDFLKLVEPVFAPFRPKKL